MNDAPSKEIVTDEMVEKAARASKDVQPYSGRNARIRAALEAAAPLFAEKYAEIAEAIERELLDGVKETPVRNWRPVFLGHSHGASHVLGQAHGASQVGETIRATKGTPHA